MKLPMSTIDTDNSLIPAPSSSPPTPPPKLKKYLHFIWKILHASVKMNPGSLRLNSKQLIHRRSLSDSRSDVGAEEQKLFRRFIHWFLEILNTYTREIEDFCTCFSTTQGFFFSLPARPPIGEAHFPTFIFPHTPNPLVSRSTLSIVSIHIPTLLLHGNMGLMKKKRKIMTRSYF